MNTTDLTRKRLLGVIVCVIFIAISLVSCDPRQEAVPIPIPMSTYGFAQCLDEPEGFYVIGGRDEWDHPLDTFLRYGAVEGIWYRLSPLPEASAGLAAACWQGKIYVVTPEQQLFIYDIQNETWSEGTSPDRVTWGAALGTWQGKLYLVSGAASEWGTPTSEVNIYDIASNTWMPYTGETIPTPARFPGYTQTGPYLYVVGGFGNNSPGQNVDATQRLDLSTLTWELGPTFTSARAALSLSITDYKLYAAGGDVDGGGFLEETALVENLDLTAWPQGSWTDTGYGMAPALMYDSGGFCTEALTGGEIWTVGGATPDEEHLNAVSTNQYGDVEEGCLHGLFNLQAGPTTQEGIGFPGEEVIYTISVTNTGGIPDAYAITTASDWLIEVGMLSPVWSGRTTSLAVTVTVPLDVLPGDTDTAQVTITSQGDPNQSASLSLTTGRYGELILTPETSAGEGARGEAVAYPITLRNATGQTDTFDLELGAYEWETMLSSALIGPLPDGGEEIVTVTVNIPGDVPWYTLDAVLVTARSQANPGEIYATSLVTTTAYAPPDLSYAPETLESIQFPDQVVTQTLTISNGNGVTLTYNLGDNIHDNVLLLALDEPEGSTFFYDSSGSGNHGTCEGDTCPDAGLPGISGYAIEFDGDDFITIPDSPELNPQNAVSISAWIYPNDWNSNRRILQKGSGDNQYRFLAEGYAFHLDIYSVGRVTTDLPLSGVWHHVVGVYDGARMQIWIDGQPSAETPATGQIPVTSEPLFIGTKYAGAPPSDFFNGKMDQVAIFDRALTPAEIISLYHGVKPTPWLTLQPVSGAIPAENAQPIQVAYYASDLQPDTYTTTLYMTTNDPLNPLAQIPVTMTVEPNPSMGWVEGAVTDLRTGEPLEATILTEGQSYSTTSDIETGYYKLWLEQGNYTLQVSASGYVTQTAAVDIAPLQGVTQDFALLLNAPWLGYSPESFSVSQITGQVTTQTLTLANTGTAPLEFSIGSIGEGITGSVLLLHLDEPSGSDTFYDSSGFNNHGSCSDIYCPVAGLTRRSRAAAKFDGIDDYIDTPLVDDPNSSLTLSAWVNPEYLNNYGSDPDGVGVGHSIIIADYSGSWGNGVGIDEDEVRIIYNNSWIVDQSFPYGFMIDQWYHITAVFDLELQTISVYVNGQIIGTKNIQFSTGGSADTYHIGYEPGVFNVPFNGMIDEVVIYNRALSPEEIQAIYVYGPTVDWLSLEPISATLPVNENLPVQFIFNANNLQPDTYTTALYISSNDPLNPSVQVPVTMTVEPTQHMGWVEGIVSDLRTGAPLEATIIAEGQPYTITSDAETGYYQLWLEHGWYNLQVTAAGYNGQSTSVHVRNHQGVTQDFALLLDAPWLEYTPGSLESTQDMGQVTTQTLTLSNIGTTPLEFTMGGGITGSTLMLHLDEPPGSTIFHDASGYGNHGYCDGDYCPQIGVDGVTGTAVHFDGSNDYISVPHNDQFDQIEDLDKITISAWVYIENWYQGWFPILDQYEATTDSGWNFEIYDSGINGLGNICGFSFAFGEWYHLAASSDRSLGYTNYYVNGEQICHIATDFDIPDTSGESAFIGFGPSGGDEYASGLVDEVYVFDQALSAEEVKIIYSGGTIGDLPWITVDPISGTIPTDSSKPIQVTFDASYRQPDTYTTTLIVSSNDPLNPLVQVPITMTVNPPIGYGELAGTFSSPGYCDQNPGALAGAELLIESSSGITWTVITDDHGHYSYWLDENGSPYTITAVLPGYETVITTGVMIIGQQTTPLDFSLRWLMPCLDSTPDQLALTLPMGMTGTLPLVITNTGAAPASFELIERNAGQVIPIQKAAVELTIQAGPDSAPVGSAVAAGSYTPRKETTYQIQPQSILVEPPRVLLLHADDSDGQWIRDQLLPYGDLAGVDSFNARWATPILAELQSYDVVLAWSNYPYADPVAVGDVLADYVDAGGHVIDLMYALGEHGWQMEGRFMDGGYNAIQGGLVKYETSCLGDHSPTHFVFNGVEDVCEFYRLRDTSLTPGASALAHWQDGEIFVASNVSRSVISITGYVGYYYRWTGQMDRVVHNAILWFMLGDDIPWLETLPVSGTVPADGGSVNISVLFDTLNYQPGEYASDLLLYSNDPMRSPIQVPISLTITPNPNMGWVEGVVTDQRTGEPMEASIHAQGQPYTVTSDADTGAYLMWLVTGVYTLEASEAGYVTQASQVVIISGTGTTQNFALMLDAPWLQYDPQEFNVTAEIDQVISRTLTLTNTGAEDLEFHFSAGISGAVLSLHLDEPPGTATFQDTSGYDNNATCLGNSCPIAGVPGVFGSSVRFDGVNDFLQIPHNAEFDQIEGQDKVSIVAWVNVDDVPYGNFAMLNQYEADGDTGWEYFITSGSVDFVNWTFNGYTSCSYHFYPNQWYHVAMTYDRSLGSIQFYVNGNQICNNAFSGDILDTADEPAYVGYNPSGGDEYAPGALDELSVFNRALTPDEIMTLYLGSLRGSAAWMSVNPTFGILPDGSTLLVQATFDATDLQTGTYTTTLFLTTNDPLLPVTQIPVAMTVTEVVTPTYDFTLLPLSPTSQAGHPGDVLTYTLEVSNTGDFEDSYSVVISASWDTAAPPTIEPILPGEDGELVVTVTIPQDAQLGDQDMATLTLTSQGDPLVSQQAALTSTAAGVYVFELQPIPPDNQEGYPGDVLTYSLQVFNLGDFVDSYNVEVSATWDTVAPSTSSPLMPGEDGELVVTVTIPLDALDGDQDIATITLTSQGDPSLSKQATLTSHALVEVHDFSVEILPPDSQEGYPGDLLAYTLVVTNLGNIAERYSLEVSATWETTAAPTIGPLLPGEEAELAVVVTIPLEALAGDQDIAILTIHSNGNPLVSQQVTLTSTAIWHSNYVPLALKN